MRALVRLLFARGSDCACWCKCTSGAAPGAICDTCRNGNHIR